MPVSSCLALIFYNSSYFFRIRFLSPHLTEFSPMSSPCPSHAFFSSSRPLSHIFLTFSPPLPHNLSCVLFSFPQFFPASLARLSLHFHASCLPLLHIFPTFPKALPHVFSIFSHVLLPLRNEKTLRHVSHLIPMSSPLSILLKTYFPTLSYVFSTC